MRVSLIERNGRHGHDYPGRVRPRIFRLCSVLEIAVVLFVIALIAVPHVLAGAVRVTVEHQSNMRKSGVFKDRLIESDIIQIDRQPQKNYVFQYSRCSEAVQQGARRVVGDGDTGLGLWIPMGQCWYGNNAIELIADGRIITRETEAQYVFWSGNDHVFVGFAWDAPDAAVTFVFRVPREGNGVFLETAISPKRELRSLQLLFRCFPGSASDVQRLGSERWVVSRSGNEARAKSTVVGGKWNAEAHRDLALRFPEDFWVLYADRLFDSEDIRIGGPCALVVAPGAIASGHVHVSAYEVQTRLDFPPEGGVARLALFEFPKWRNSMSLTYLRDNGNDICRALEQDGFEIVELCRSEARRLLDLCRRRLPEPVPGLPEEVRQARKEFDEHLRVLGVDIDEEPIGIGKLRSIQKKAEGSLTDITRFALEVMVNY